MTIYQCDTCSQATPGGANGTSFLVQPDGRTDHFCSSACLRAFVNRDAGGTPSNVGVAIITVIFGGAITVLYAVAESLIRH